MLRPLPVHRPPSPLRAYAESVIVNRGTTALLYSLAVTVTVAFADPVVAQSITPNPSGSGVIANAVNWLTGTLLGNVATGIAVLAVAVIAILLMTGRMEWGRAALVVIGIFVLFGAVTIVSGIRSIAGGA
jgi:type IV secretory pathway VirB2 component (pilin)